MSSTRCSKLFACCLVAVLALSAAAPAAAISADSEDVPGEAEVGTTVSASATFADLYTENERWQLNATTELGDQPKWTLELIDDGDVVETKSRVGQNVTFSNATVESPFDKVRVSVEGTVPAVGNYSYADEETFTTMSLAQVPVASDGSTGSPSTFQSYETHHYTADSKDAREAIDAAASTIEEASTAGADVSQAESSLSDAKAFYRNGDFDQAVSNAEEAETQADDALSQQESSEQTQQLLVFAAVGVLVLALIGGGVYWYRQNQQDTSRLG